MVVSIIAGNRSVLLPAKDQWISPSTSENLTFSRALLNCVDGHLASKCYRDTLPMCACVMQINILYQ